MWTYDRGQTLFLPDISANVVKSEIKIAHWFFVRGRERNWWSSGDEACVATKDDNNINVLPTRSSSRQQKKASESEQLHELLSSWTQSERFPNTCRTSLPGPTGLPDKRVHSRKFYGLRLPAHPFVRYCEIDLSLTRLSVHLYTSSVCFCHWVSKMLRKLCKELQVTQTHFYSLRLQRTL